ncbi:MAG: TonB-dependent receptor plug domain-containing protein [Nannocystaceae bacterium]|nr:TonB-dependent receptor [bacterium]
MSVVLATWLAAAPQPAPDGSGLDAESRTVVVTATRTAHEKNDAPIATDVYDRQTIEDTGAENAMEVLEETPGVQISRGVGGAGVLLQGLDPKYTLILVDGQRVSGRIGGTIDLSRIPADDIERIEIVRGPGSVLYGADSLAGTINIITRRAAKPWEAEAHSAYGSFNTVDLTGRVGHRRDRYAGSFSAGVHNTDGWDADPSNESTTGPSSRQFEASTSQRFTSKGMFALDGWAQYLQRTTRGVDALGTGAVFDRVNRSETITANVTPSASWDDGAFRFTASYSLFRDQFFNDQRGSDALDDSQDTFDHIAQGTATLTQQIERHVVTAGADGQFEFLSANRIDPGNVGRQRYAVFVQDEWMPLEALSILPGVRLDYDSLFGLYPTPRIAVMARPNAKWRLRASYGRGYRAPTFREMYLRFTNAGVGYQVRGNPSLQPETSWSTHVSAQYFPWRWVSISVAAFDHRLQDTIVVDTVDDSDDALTLFGYDNIGNAESRGVESSASVQWGPMTLDGSYTFTHARDLDSGRRLPGRARHRGTVGARLHRRAWGTTLRIRSAITGARTFYVDENDDDVLEPLDSAPFATLDVRLAQTFTRYVEAYFGVDNILDAGNATDNPLVPRSYYGGITVRY